MQINYILNNDEKYSEIIGKGLGRHNDAATGKLDHGNFNLYLLEGEAVVGAIHSFHFWDWAGIDNIWFKDGSIFEILVNEVYKQYEGKYQGMYYMSFDPEMLNRFYQLGYHSIGHLKDRPIGYETHELINYNTQAKQINHTYKLEVHQTKDDPHADWFKEKIEEEKAKKFTIQPQKKVQFVAFNGEEVVGGAISYLSHDYLYVSILWVDENYRKEGIATKLMSLTETHALKHGFNNFFLGTGSFQARGFYEKLNYQVVGTIKDFPIGFEMYTMKKTVD